MQKIGQADIPAVGFGTYPLEGREAQQAVEQAIELGYRHIDTAQMYGNEAAVGQALGQCGLERDALFITTKVDPSNVAPEGFLSSVERSLEDLSLSRVDLLLLHWPSLDRPLEESLASLLQAKQQGYARHIGVSNFTCLQLKEAAGLYPGEIAVNQVEFHPLIDQRPLQQLGSELGVLLMAYCPLARGRVLENPVLQAIAARYDKTVAQVTLRWIYQQNVAAISMSTKPRNAAANLDIFDFELSSEEMAGIEALNAGHLRLVSPKQWAPKWDGPLRGR